MSIMILVMQLLHHNCCYILKCREKILYLNITDTRCGTDAEVAVELWWRSLCHLFLDLNPSVLSTRLVPELPGSASSLLRLLLLLLASFLIASQLDLVLLVTQTGTDVVPMTTDGRTKSSSLSSVTNISLGTR